MTPESLATNLEHQLEQSAAIREYAWTIVEREHKGEFSPGDYAAFALFYRCLQTHEAIEIVARRSLFEDAWVLVRALTEYSVNCAYMLNVADAQTADDFIDYPKFRRYGELQDLKETDETLFRQMWSAEEEEESRKQYEAVRLRFQNRPGDRWCIDDRLYKRAARVDQKISEAEGEAQTSFKWLVNTVWRHASTHLHGMADSLANQVSEVKDGVALQRKYVPEEGAEAVHAANLAFFLVFLLVDLRLGGKNAEEIKLRFAKWGGT